MIDLRTEFKPKALRAGIKITDEDLRFIERHLWKLPPEAHKRVLRDYLFQWALGMRKTLKMARAQDFGRKMANDWLEALVNGS